MYCFRQIFPALLLLLTGTFLTARGQSPFETSTLGAGFSTHLTDSELTEYWSRGTGFAVWWRTPFYLGELELHAARLPYISKEPEVQPGLTNIQTSMTWGIPVRIGSRITLFGGILIGNSFFYQTGKGPFEYPESEFSAGFSGRLTLRLTDRTTLQARLQQTRIYTYHRIDDRRLTVGLEYRFDTPGWLKSFLR
ncbi:MAG: hypothetical protein WD355_01610 [Balneolaceae bacterium]